MSVAYVMFVSGIGGAVLLPPACLLLGFSKGRITNFSNTILSTLPGKKSAVAYNLLHGAYAMGALFVPILLIAFTAKKLRSMEIHGRTATCYGTACAYITYNSSPAQGGLKEKLQVLRLQLCKA